MISKYSECVEHGFVHHALPCWNVISQFEVSQALAFEMDWRERCCVVSLQNLSWTYDLVAVADACERVDYREGEVKKKIDDGNGTST